MAQCRARMHTHGNGGLGSAKPGDQCPSDAVHVDPAGIPLCWIHSHARYNTKRAVPLQMLPSAEPTRPDGKR